MGYVQESINKEITNHYSQGLWLIKKWLWDEQEASGI